MIRNTWWVTPASSLVLLWHECGEDVVVFCYRISRSAALWVRSRAENATATF
jgi:hypothetical protein